MKRVRRPLVVAAAMFVALASGARSVGADCPPERNRARVVFTGFATGGFDHGLADVLSLLVLAGLRTGARDVEFVSYEELQVLLGNQTTLQSSGNLSDVSGVAGALGVPFLFQLEFRQEQNSGEAPIRTATGTLLSLRDATVVRRAQQRLTPGDGASALTAKMNGLAADVTPGLACDLLGRREHPVVPALKVEVTPQEVAPNATVHVKVTLKDASDGQVQPAKDVRIANKHGSNLLASTRFETSFFGVVETDVNVGPDAGDGAIEASFTDSRGRTTKSNPASFAYRVRTTTGDLQATAPQAELEVGTGATVTARLTHDGAPVAGATVSFAASGGGGTADAAVVTDADGIASTQYAAPSVNAVVDVTASAPAQAPAPGAPDLTASLTFVVDGGVTLNLNALDTAAGGTSDVTADLVVGGTAVPGADVTFTLTGAGALSAPAAPTDDAGRAEVTWIAPAGNSSATITATTVVDGQTYTKDVTVHAGPFSGFGVKLLATMTGIAWHTFAETGVHGPAYDTPLCNVATLAGAQACSGGGVVVDFGSGSVDAPLTLQPALAEGTISNRMTVTHPDPNVVVVEFTVANSSSGTAIADSACLELAFDTAGSLTIDADPSAFSAGLVDPRVMRPKPGPAFTDGGQYYQDSFAGFYGTMTTESIDVGQRETYQLVIQFNSERYTSTPPDGTYKLTLTFHPQ